MAQAIAPNVTVERLLEVLYYDEDTGKLHRKPNLIDEAGYHVAGRRGVSVDTHLILAHRAIWAMKTGAWPPDDMEVDHRDRDPMNNRWDNLRLATHAQNMMNRGPDHNNKSGYKGVCASTVKKAPWRAYITLEGKQHKLGNFLTKEEAARAYDKKARELFGEFAFQNMKG